MINNDEITVYDDYKINLCKYPRINTEKEYTDIIIIIFLTHEDFLKKLSISFEDSLKYYHECKEYYYIFNFNKIIRKYSAQEIMLLIKNTNDYFRENTNINIQLKYLNNLLLIDQIFYFYIKNKNFYINLFEALEDAKKAYFERRDYSYRIIPPTDFYTNITPKIYNAIELMEIYSYTNYLVKRKIIKDLPIPKYLDIK
jgi:hypothetical protein